MWFGLIVILGDDDDDNLSSCTENSDDPSKVSAFTSVRKILVDLLIFLYSRQIIAKRFDNLSTYYFIIISPKMQRSPFSYIYNINKSDRQI